MNSSFSALKSENPAMYASNYSTGSSQSYSYYQNYKMRNSGYAYSRLFSSNSNGFYPTAISSNYSNDNPNAKITSKAEEMMKKAEVMSRMITPDISNDASINQIK